MTELGHHDRPAAADPTPADPVSAAGGPARAADDPAPAADDPAGDATAPPPGDGEATAGAPAEEADRTGWRARIEARVVATGDWAEANVPWWWLVREGWDRYWRLNAPVLAGHIAFRTFVFLLPVAFLLVAVAGFLRSTGNDPQSVGDSLGLGQAIGQSMRQAGQDSQEAWYHVAWVAGAGLLMGSLGLASGLHYVYLQLWQLPFQKPEGKLRATLEMGSGFIAILLVAVVAHALRSRGLLAGTAGVALLALVGFGGFLGLGIALPRRASEWRWLIPGSVVGAAGVVGLQVFGAVYLPSRLASFSQTYGAFGIAATFIFYLYLIGQLLVLSVVINAVWFDHYRPDEAPPPAPDAARADHH